MKEPRRCGRIAGSLPFNLPQGTGARLFAAGALALRGMQAGMPGLRKLGCARLEPRGHGIGDHGSTAAENALVESALVAQAHHFLDEHLFLLVVEARVERLGRVGDAALIDGAVVEELSLVAHLLDDVVRRVALGTSNSQVEAVGAIVAEVVHRARETGPVLFLFGRQIQFGLDPVDIGIAVGDDLLGGQRRRALPG